MTKILAVTTHGTNDPTLCTAAFVTAIGALGAGKEVGVTLIAEAVYLTNPAIVKTIHGVGFPPLSELINTVLEGNVPIYV